MTARAKFQQLTIGILAVLSIFAAPLSACICSHHKAEVKAESASCHDHPAESAKISGSAVSDLSNSFRNVEGCICVQASAKAVAKSENLKFKKHAKAPLVLPAIESTVFRTTSPSLIEADFEPLAALDPFDKFKPSRGPPRL